MTEAVASRGQGLAVTAFELVKVHGSGAEVRALDVVTFSAVAAAASTASRPRIGSQSPCHPAGRGDAIHQHTVAPPLAIPHHRRAVAPRRRLRRRRHRCPDRLVRAAGRRCGPADRRLRGGLPGDDRSGLVGARPLAGPRQGDWCARLAAGARRPPAGPAPRPWRSPSASRWSAFFCVTGSVPLTRRLDGHSRVPVGARD